MGLDQSETELANTAFSTKKVVWSFPLFCFSPLLVMFGKPSHCCYCSQSHMLAAASKKLVFFLLSGKLKDV